MRNDQLFGPNVEDPELVASWLSRQEKQKPKAFFEEYGEVLQGRGQGYGYLIKTNRQLVEHDPSSKVSFHCCSPFGINARRGKTNIVSSMWESRDLHISAVNKFRTVDAVITPSKWCTRNFKKILDCPVYTVPLWVDSSVWQYRKREVGEKFRWLWVASADPRKGWPIVSRMWERFFVNNPNVELYLKTTADSGEDLGVVQHGNMTIDRRTIPRDDLVELYHSAHGFIYPSSGEGFGWTCAEALSTGLPVVGTSVTGHSDFFTEQYGYTVPTNDCLFDSKEPTTSGQSKYHMYVASSDGLGERMTQVMNSYDTALKRAGAGSDNIHKNYTFEQYVDKLYGVLGKYS